MAVAARGEEHQGKEEEKQEQLAVKLQEQHQRMQQQSIAQAAAAAPLGAPVPARLKINPTKARPFLEPLITTSSAAQLAVPVRVACYMFVGPFSASAARAKVRPEAPKSRLRRRIPGPQRPYGPKWPCRISCPL